MQKYCTERLACSALAPLAPPTCSHVAISPRCSEQGEAAPCPSRWPLPVGQGSSITATCNVKLRPGRGQGQPTRPAGTGPRAFLCCNLPCEYRATRGLLDTVVPTGANSDISTASQLSRTMLTQPCSPREDPPAPNPLDLPLQPLKDSLAVFPHFFRGLKGQPHRQERAAGS